MAALPVNRIRQPAHALAATVLFLFLVGIYLDVGTSVSEGVRIPSIIALAVLPVLLPLARIRGRDIGLILTVFCLAVLTVPFVPGEAVIERRALAILQLMAAMLGGIAVARLMVRMRERTVERIFQCLWFTILLLAVLEGLGSGESISNQFREFAFGDVLQLETSHYRDLELVGRSRPAVFTAEPSYAYLGFIVFSTAWLLMRCSWSRTLLLLAANIIMLILMASPLFLLAVLAITVVFTTSNDRKPMGHGVGAFLAIATVGAAYFFGGEIMDLVVERLDLSDIEEYSSAHIRIVYPVLALIDVTTVSPVFGLGLGGEVNLEQYSRFALSYLEAAGTNAFFLLLITLGPVGGLILMCVLVRYWRKEWTTRVLLALFLFLFAGAQMGGSVTMRFWGYVFVLIGALSIADRVRVRGRSAKAPREGVSGGRALKALGQKTRPAHA